MQRYLYLNEAKRRACDEFYTPMDVIESGLRGYWGAFEGRRMYCNCDDPFESNFFKYFILHFNEIGIESVTATCLNGGRRSSLLDDGAVNGGGRGSAWMARVSNVPDGFDPVESGIDGLMDMDGNELHKLDGTGDFRSVECHSILDESEIVATNPPFSLFIDYMSMLLRHDMKFAVMGPMVGIHYKSIFPHIASGEIHVSNFNGMFMCPNAGLGASAVKMSNVCWFSNIDIGMVNPPLELTAHYDPDLYPRYDDVDAINVDLVNMIPCDYDGIMGVPESFMCSWNPDQFEIVGNTVARPRINGKDCFIRVLIRRKRR